MSYDERSQHQNKKIALFRLIEKLEKLEVDKASKDESRRWKYGINITGGEEILVFEGDGFILF